MQKSGFDPEALVSMFASAGAKQSAQVKEAVTRATLAALQGRELTLKNIREALKNVSQAASTGMAKNPASSIDVEKLLNDAVTGMDQALLKAVEANQRALQQFVDQGADLKEKHLKKAIDDLDKFEDMLFGAIKTAAGTAGGKLAAPWEQVLERMKAGGTMSGTQASATVEQMAAQMQTAMRGTRTAGLRAAQALAESYTALVSGVLIGMSDALRQGSAAKPARKKA
jgi:primosomal protein N''